MAGLVCQSDVFFVILFAPGSGSTRTVNDLRDIPLVIWYSFDPKLYNAKIKLRSPDAQFGVQDVARRRV